MLVFVIPLQGRQASRDWSRVSALVGRTLRSVLNQTHPSFHVYLVCSDIPDHCPSNPSLTVVRRDFPTPRPTERMADKWNKVKVGLISLRSRAPCHVMVTDADDCVSNRLAGHVAAHAGADGWYFDRGWLRDEGSRLIYHRRHDFDAVCGTSSIVRAESGDLPESEASGKESSIILRSGHRHIRQNMIDRGTPLTPLPFAGAVYNVATGENDSLFSLRGWRSKRVMVKKLFGYRLLTAGMRAEFGLTELDER